MLLTHLHSDHTTDFNDVLTTWWVMPFTAGRPLPVVGPPGTQAFVDRTIAAMVADVGYRIDHHDDLNDPPSCTVTEVSDGAAYELGTLRVTAGLVDHGVVRPAIGYRFEDGDSIATWSGDTLPCAGLDALAAGASCYVQTVIRRDLVEQVPVPALPRHPRLPLRRARRGRHRRPRRPRTLVLNHMVPAPLPGTEGKWRDLAAAAGLRRRGARRARPVDRRLLMSEPAAPINRAACCRGQRNRDAVVQSFLDLIAEGDLSPTAQKVAERAGVSLRSVFHHFEDMEQLSRVGRRPPRRPLLVAGAAARHGPPARRAHRRVRRPARPPRRGDHARLPSVAASPRTRSPTVADRIDRGNDLLRNQAANVLRPSSPTWGDPDQRLEAIDALTTIDGSIRLRVAQGLSATRARRGPRRLAPGPALSRAKRDVARAARRAQRGKSGRHGLDLDAATLGATSPHVLSRQEVSPPRPTRARACSSSPMWRMPCW